MKECYEALLIKSYLWCEGSLAIEQAQEGFFFHSEMHML